MTSPSGSFRSHKAAVSEMDPRSQYCSWLITLAETYIISLSFKELTIPSCYDTFLRIYDGSNNTAPLLATYCGSNASTEVVILSSTNSLYIVSNSGSYARSAKNNFSFYAQYQAPNLAGWYSANLDNGFLTLTGVILSHYLFPVGKPIYSRWVVDF
jgi:hypothetical protein